MEKKALVLCTIYSFLFKSVNTYVSKSIETLHNEEKIIYFIWKYILSLDDNVFSSQYT